MKTRSYVSLRVACAPQRRERVRAAHLGRASARCPSAARLPLQDPHRARRRARRTPPCRRPARAPRCRARRVPANRSSTRAPCDVAEHREQRLPDAVGGRPRRPAPRRLQAPAAEASRDHAHAHTVTPRDGVGARGDRLERLGAEARSSASPSSACSGARSSGSPATIASARARARSSSCASSGRRATRNCPTPDWRVPISSPSLRSARSISARRKPSACSTSARSRAEPARSAGPTRKQLADARRARPARAAGAAGRSRSARRSRPASRSRSARRCPTSITVVATSTSARPTRTPPSPPASRAGACRRAAARAR